MGELSPNLAEAILEEHTRLSLPSNTAWIEPTVEYLREKALFSGLCTEEGAGKLLMSLHEALSNAIIHGNFEISSELRERADDSYLQLLAARSVDPAYCRRVVDIAVNYDGEKTTWQITDEGKGFNVGALMAKLNSDDPSELASGRGVLIMRSFMDGLHYENGGRTCILTMKQELPEDRRGKPRIAMHSELQIVPILEDGTVDWDAAYKAICRNLSEQGIAILQNRLTEFDRILVRITVDDKKFSFPAEVRHSRDIGNSMFELGCEFRADAKIEKTRKTPNDLEDAIVKFLENHAKSHAVTEEKRSNIRVPFHDLITIIADDYSQALVAYPRNLSKSGISFLTSVPLSGIVTIQFPSGGKVSPLEIQTEITRCSKIQAQFYDVAGRFLAIAHHE